MALGKSVEIAITVEDSAVAVAFYERLGFKKLADDAVTDGNFNLRFKTDGSPSPTLSYYDVDFDDVRAAGIPVKATGTVAVMNTIDGLRLSVNTESSDIPMPDGTPATRTPISKCGKLGEFAMKVSSYKKSSKFWQKLGFAELHKAEIPYTYGFLSDGLIVLGLHEGMDTNEPHLTYFAGDMADRIADIQKQGVTIEALTPPENGKIGNAKFAGEGGEKYYLFTGEI